MQTGWLNDHGTWYYLKSSGALATGWETAKWSMVLFKTKWSNGDRMGKSKWNMVLS